MFFYLAVFIVFIVRCKRKGRLIFFTYGLPEPYGGTKILHTPLPMGAGQGRGGPVQPSAASAFRAFFSPFRSRPGPGDRPSCLPYYGEPGRCKEKAGAVKKAGFGRGSLAVPVQGFCPHGPCLLGACAGRDCACRSVSARRCPARLARARLRRGHRGNRPPDTGKGPRKTGALADVGLSGP